MEMDNNPLLPNSLQDWGVFVLLVILYGAVYYVAGFPILWRSFQQMEQVESVTCWKGHLLAQKGDIPPTIIAGRIYYPIAVSDATTLPSFFTVWNATDTTLTDIRFWMVHEQEDAVEGFFLPSFVQKEMLRRTLDVPSLFPKERINFRVDLLGSDGKVWGLNWSAVRGGKHISGECVYGENYEEEIAILPSMPVAVALGLLERALLPPWSNVVVLVVALVATGALKNRWEKANNRISNQKVFLWLWALDIALWGIALLFLSSAYFFAQLGEWWQQAASFIFETLLVGGMSWCVFKPCGVYREKEGSTFRFQIQRDILLWGAGILGGVVLFVGSRALVGFGRLDATGMWFFGGEMVVALFLIVCALPILRQWRWDKELSLQREELEWVKGTGRKRKEDEQDKHSRNSLSFSTWIPGWQRHLSALEKAIKDIGKDKGERDEVEEKIEKEEESLSKWFWHQERGPHEDALAIATWLYPEVVGLHCQWLAEKYTRQQRDVAASSPKWLYAVKRKLGRRQESQSLEEASPWRKFLDDLEAWGKGLKKVREAASLPEGEMPPSWPQQPEFQQLWHQLRRWGDGNFSIDDERYNIRNLQKFFPARFLAFYDFAVRQREKSQHEQKKQEKEEDISKPESDEKQ